MSFIINIETCTLMPDSGATSKIRKKSKFYQNELKPETQHKNMYMYQEKL